MPLQLIDMENGSAVPRPIPPQPKSLNIQPPSHAVPDVTLMFDSDDSLIWKPGEKPKAFLPNKSNKQKLEHVPLNSVSARTSPGLGSIATVLTNVIESQKSGSENKPQSPTMPGSPIISTGSASSIIPVSKSHKYRYNPEVYASPKPVTGPTRVIQGLIPTSTVCNREDIPNATEVSPSFPQPAISKVPHISNVLKPPKKSVIFQDDLLDNDPRRPFSSSSSTPTYKEPSKDLDVCHDPYILKLIEGQNQQILYLHKVLEKVLEKLTINDGHCKSCLHEKCLRSSCNKENVEHKVIQKVAIVQTSISEIKPESCSVATNTDLSWAQISPFFNDSEQRKPVLITEEVTKRANQPILADIRSTPQPLVETKGLLQGSAKKEASLTLHGINLETAYDPPCPDPSLRLDIPDYQEQSEVGASISSHNNCEFEGDEYPLMGESALVYGTRRQREEERSPFAELAHGHRTHNQEIPTQAADVGLTFYDNVLNNVQQILGRAKEVDDCYEDDRRPPTKEGVRSASSNPSQPVSLHPQQFGISFLDPTTLAQKPTDAATSFDTFYVPAMLGRGNDCQDLEMVGDTHWQRRALGPNRVSDNRLVAIARQCIRSHLPGQVYPDGSTRTKQTLPRERGENDFSFATKQFLGKYELDN